MGRLGIWNSASQIIPLFPGSGVASKMTKTMIGCDAMIGCDIIIAPETESLRFQIAPFCFARDSEIARDQSL